MKKDDAIELLSNGKRNESEAARVLGISRHTVRRWPDPLPQAVEDRVRGAYIRITEERDRKAVTVFRGGQ